MVNKGFRGAFSRVCKNCEQLYKPLGKYQTLCEPCQEKAFKAGRIKAFKNRKKTLSRNHTKATGKEEIIISTKGKPRVGMSSMSLFVGKNHKVNKNV